MNPGQKMFYDFFMERVTDGKQDEAKALLEQSFQKQADGTFDQNYMAEVMPKFFAIVKPEAAEELKTAMASFSARLK